MTDEAVEQSPVSKTWQCNRHGENRALVLSSPPSFLKPAVLFTVDLLVQPVSLPVEKFTVLEAYGRAGSRGGGI